ncbi:MAG: SUMF1/EgtB/PvdO family nonheme iron enzyme [Deltaproteobacteria bacterium]|nr:SUMF1/EgtB/PvdO family nonheme iron enzyme [Deltaproteobacteria bacterium]
MLDAKYFPVYEAPPHDELTMKSGKLEKKTKKEQADIDKIVKAVADPKTEVVFVGGPIWTTFTEPMRRLIATLDLKGRLVVPFCTHGQEFHKPRESSRKLRELIRSQGGRAARPMVIRLPFNFSEDEILAKVRRILPRRRDLWWNRDEVGKNAVCDTKGDTRQGPHLCSVPAGLAWVWKPLARGAFSTVYSRRPRLVAVDGFAIDQTEVTISQFRRCRNDGTCPKTKMWIGTCKVLATDGEDDIPMPCVGMKEADDWCRARGMRLPTLAEWTRAARGDSDDPYPWGREFTYSGRLGNFGEDVATNTDLSACVHRSLGESFVSDGFAGLSPPCSFEQGRSRFGLCDMAGNIGEWVVFDGKNNQKAGGIAGGTWFDCEPEAYRVDRTYAFPFVMAYDGTGFRCARSVSVQTSAR